MEAFEILKSMDAFGYWTPTSLDTLRKCPRLFFVRYVVGMRSDGDDMYRHVGNAVHDILCDITRNPGEVNIRKLLEKVRVDYRMSSAEMTLLHKFRQGIVHWAQRTTHFTKENPTAVLRAEQPMEVLSSGEVAGQPMGNSLLKLRVDFLVVKDKHIAIIDHKTGHDATADKFEFILMLYALACRLKWPNLRSVRGGIYQVRTCEQQYCKPFVTDKEDELSGSLPQQLKKIKAGYSTLTNLPRDSTAAWKVEGRSGPHCKWCPVNKVCTENVSG